MSRKLLDSYGWIDAWVLPESVETETTFGAPYLIFTFRSASEDD
jgi:hypothetical protein